MKNPIETWWNKQEECDQIIIRKCAAYLVLILGIVLTIIFTHLMSEFFLIK